MWRHTLLGLGPHDDPETWAQELAEQEWQLWILGNTGATVTILAERCVGTHSAGDAVLPWSPWSTIR